MTQDFTKMKGVRSTWHLSSGLMHDLQSTRSFHILDAPTQGSVCSSKSVSSETIHDSHHHQSPLESIQELEANEEVAPHASMTMEEHQVTADVSGMGFQFSPSVVCFPCLLSNNSQCDGQSPSCSQCLQSGLNCEEHVPFLTGGEMCLETFP
ncbi:Putative zn(2)Cys(6) fungal-type DNA-binding domain-containing protein [Colletotrichum destructivum]|uniref:Zn(2)Cys(6) fungal-type DNA-binding domain-containing protein n=1 Tax=Colletotrichum destructivum TaxID=34406 RepID=A0AAX4J4Q1_9PEZI|nr:Putative zn(2)Cys(6) fungal-type DNA-binding domain-containing protein [Colletotrichum destructivum]WQF90508.1 Putative zn(2)Cys(6) fungal-type DNA-binding domain-containing protein [Colletotrichum destructivum]